MTPWWLQRSAVVLLAAMGLALIVGFIAVGPMPVDPSRHQLADRRSWGPLREALNTLTAVPLAVLGLWSWARMRGGGTPEVARMRRTFFLLVGIAGVLTVLYHQAPGDAGFKAVQLGVGLASVSLLLWFLTERIDARCGSTAVLWGGVAVGMAATLWAFLSGDLRGAWLLQTLPLLLIPAGALHLPGRGMSASDWSVALSAYVLAHVAGYADAALFDLTGWISGHSLMHLALAFVVGWLSLRGVDHESDGASRPSTSFNTTLW